MKLNAPLASVLLMVFHLPLDPLYSPYRRTTIANFYRTLSQKPVNPSFSKEIFGGHGSITGSGRSIGQFQFNIRRMTCTLHIFHSPLVGRGIAPATRDRTMFGGGPEGTPPYRRNYCAKFPFPGGSS